MTRSVEGNCVPREGPPCPSVRPWFPGGQAGACPSRLRLKNCASSHTSRGSVEGQGPPCPIARPSTIDGQAGACAACHAPPGFALLIWTSTHARLLAAPGDAEARCIRGTPVTICPIKSSVPATPRHPASFFLSPAARFPLRSAHSDSPPLFYERRCPDSRDS